MNRGDLMDAFSASVKQASTDRNRYIGMAPDTMVYDQSTWTYDRGSQFERLFLKLDAGRYPSQLRSVANRILDRADAWTGQLPPYDAAPTPMRGVKAKTLLSAVTPIRQFKAIEVRYQSLSWPGSRWRWIAPHAIGSDGLRWHTRTFCFTDDTFKGFVLYRIIEARGTQPSEVGPEADSGRNKRVTLEIGLYPKLSHTQQKVIALDYGMRSGNAKILVRKALLYYAPKRLGLDADPAARFPRDQQVILLNREKVLRCGLANSMSGDHQ